MASEDKFGRLRQLVDSGKEKGYVLYDEVNDLLPDDIATGPELDDLLADFDSAGVEILEEPKLEFDKKLDEGEEFAELDLAQDFGDKTNDPVRMYLREMGTVPLLTREGEIELAKRIERGQRSVNKSLSRSPLIIREVAAFAEEIRRGQLQAGDVLITVDPISTEEEGAVDPETVQLLADIEEIERLYKKVFGCRQRLAATPRQTKPRQYRGIRFEFGRTLVTISRKIRILSFSSSTRRHLVGKLRAAVEEFKALEKEIARAHRRAEECETPEPVSLNGRDSKRELRQLTARMQQLEEDCGVTVGRTSPNASDPRSGRSGSRRRQETVNRGQPSSGGFNRQAIYQSRVAVPRLDSGRQHRPDEGRGQVRLPTRVTSSRRTRPGGSGRPSRAQLQIRLARSAFRST